MADFVDIVTEEVVGELGTPVNAFRRVEDDHGNVVHSVGAWLVRKDGRKVLRIQSHEIRSL